MGDLVVIQVIASNIDTGQIDFKLKSHKGKKVSKKTNKVRSNLPGRTYKTSSHHYPFTVKNKDQVRSRKNKRSHCTKKRKIDKK